MVAENTAAFLADFGEVAVVDSISVRGLWFDSYLPALDVQATGPAFGAWLADLPSGVTTGSTLVRGATTYRVIEPQPDGTGWTVLRLERQ
jgi:hypothetical protein